MSRIDGRKFDELRPVKIVRNYMKHAEGSVLIQVGDTKVICTASKEEAGLQQNIPCCPDQQKPEIYGKPHAER